MTNRLEALSQLRNRIDSSSEWCGAFDDQAMVQRAYIELEEKADIRLWGIAMDVSSASQEMKSGDK